MDDCIKVEHGDDVMNKIERIRALATSYNTLSTLEPEPARKAEATDEVRDAKDVEPHPVDSNTIGDLSDALRDRLLHELTTLRPSNSRMPSPSPEVAATISTCPPLPKHITGSGTTTPGATSNATTCFRI